MQFSTEFIQMLDEDEEGNAIWAEALKGNNLSFHLFATLNLHFNAWTATEFPSSDACLEDLIDDDAGDKENSNKAEYV